MRKYTALLCCVLCLWLFLGVTANAAVYEDEVFLTTPSPIPTPTSMPTPTPAPFVVPQTLTPVAEAMPTAIRHDVVAGTKEVKEYQRDVLMDMPSQAEYSVLPGVLTFRGGPYRQNAAYGTVPEGASKLTVVWEKRIGSIDNWSGVGWNGQPAIVAWPVNLQTLMNIVPEKKSDTLREVIYAALDGRIYFLDLTDGQPTREAIRVGFPLKGSVSVDPRGVPLLYSGQGISVNGDKTGKIGLHIFSLIDQTELYFLNGKDDAANRRHGAFDSVPLVDAASDTLIAAGENGLLYTLALNTVFSTEVGAVSIDPQKLAYRYRTGKTVGIENSPAVLGHYAYFTDNSGYLQCVDLNTMDLIWHAGVTDDSDATIALEPEADGRVALYTGCEVDLQKSGGKAYLRRFNALTGALEWEVAIPCTYDADLNGGLLGSPLVGQQEIADLVIFHVAKTKDGGTLLALDKQTGEEVWRQAFKRYGWSSPVAVYDAYGNARIVLGDSGGNLRLLDGRTGVELDRIELTGNIEGSPAVFDDMLVIGTRGCWMYGIRIE